MFRDATYIVLYTQLGKYTSKIKKECHHGPISGQIEKPFISLPYLIMNAFPLSRRGLPLPGGGVAFLLIM